MVTLTIEAETKKDILHYMERLKQMLWQGYNQGQDGDLTWDLSEVD